MSTQIQKLNQFLSILKEAIFRVLHLFPTLELVPERIRILGDIQI
jgi:hypothetical protein